GEIEAVLGSHADVADCAVILREDRKDDKRLVAYVVPRAAAALDSAALRSFLKQRLPDYMLPSHFVTLPQLPQSSSGKVDRRALPAPGLTESITQVVARPPRDTVELMLVQLWESL